MTKPEVLVPNIPTSNWSLELPDFVITEMQTQEGIRLYGGRASANRATCSRCAESDVYRHGTRVQRFADLPVRGVKIVIDLERQRYQCRLCTATFFDLPEAFDAKRSVTTRLRRYLASETLSQPFLVRAELVGVDERTVRSIFADSLRSFESTRNVETPTVLGIDKVHTRRSYHLVVANNEYCRRPSDRDGQKPQSSIRG